MKRIKPETFIDMKAQPNNLLNLKEPSVAKAINAVVDEYGVKIKGTVYLTPKGVEAVKDEIYRQVLKVKARYKKKPTSTELYIDNWLDHTKGIITTLLTVADTMYETKQAITDKVAAEYQAELSGVKP